MKVKVLEYVEWKDKDRPGTLAWYTQEFKARGVDMEALWCGSSGLAASAKNPSKLRAALKALKKSFKSGRCLMLTGADQPGALTQWLRRLAQAGINVAGAEALAADGHFSMTLCLKGKDLPRAQRLLKS